MRPACGIRFRLRIRAQGIVPSRLTSSDHKILSQRGRIRGVVPPRNNRGQPHAVPVLDADDRDVRPVAGGRSGYPGAVSPAAVKRKPRPVGRGFRFGVDSQDAHRHPPDSQIFTDARLTGIAPWGIPFMVRSNVRRHLEASKWWNGCGACGWVSHTHLRGPRETLPGPTMWVRPATGWWGRMNAGESPRNQGRSVWPPLSVSRRRSRGRRKNAAVERREANALRYWACAARRSTVIPRLSALRSLTSGEQGNAGAPRASREQGRRSFVVLPAGYLKCESDAHA
jgi:hypothetical protein